MVRSKALLVDRFNGLHERVVLESVDGQVVVRALLVFLPLSYLLVGDFFYEAPEEVVVHVQLETDQMRQAVGPGAVALVLLLQIDSHLFRSLDLNDVPLAFQLHLGLQLVRLTTRAIVRVIASLRVRHNHLLGGYMLFGVRIDNDLSASHRLKHELSTAGAGRLLRHRILDSELAQVWHGAPQFLFGLE